MESLEACHFMIAVLLLSSFLKFHLIVATCAPKRRAFGDVIPGRAMTGVAVLTSGSTATEEHCQYECVKVPQCIMYNYHSSGMCEVLDGNIAVYKLVPKTGWSFKGQQCKSNMCLNGGTCYGMPDEDHPRCLCPAGYIGSSCSKYCVGALGMQHRRILNSQITASSYYANDARHAPWEGRLHNVYSTAPSTMGAWVGGSPSPAGEWMQIDLIQEMVVSKVATQGRPPFPPFNPNSWVTKYTVSYSQDGTQWTEYDKVFAGNADKVTVVTNTIDGGVRGRYIRINPKELHGGIGLRVELYGCTPP